MALQKEIWLNHLVEKLFADNSFMVKSFDASEFADNGKTCHIPNEAALPGVKKNRQRAKGAEVTDIQDGEIVFSIDEYTTDPVIVVDADKKELSYDKRDSLIRRSVKALDRDIARDVIVKWSPSSTGSILETTGASVRAHLNGTTGNRKAFTRADVLAAQVLFNNADIPEGGRYMLVDSMMHAQLLESLTEAEAKAYHALADLKRGVLGNLLGFDIMQRSTAAVYTSAKAPKLYEGKALAADDRAAALCWHEDYVCRAIGERRMFDNPGDATYYGDIMSFLLRAGGEKMSTDQIGVAAIIQANA